MIIELMTASVVTLNITMIIIIIIIEITEMIKIITKISLTTII